MKTAHTEWFNKLPDDWLAIPIKYGFRWIGSGTTPPSDEIKYYGGTIPWVNTSELRENIVFSTEKQLTTESIDEFSALKIYPVDTVLFAMYGATIGRVAILGIPATVNQAVCALADPSKFISRFVFYGLQASREYLATLASGGGQPNLNAEKVRDHKLPCPPLDIQRYIADYLDAETAQIDTLIAEKERMLALLAEKRAALVSQAVTQGLDPTVPMKPSGLEWLGQIPAHWKIKRAKWMFEEIDLRSTTGEETLLSLRMIQGLVPHNDVSEKPIPSKDLIGYKVVQPNEIVINRMRAASGLIAISPQNGIVSPDYAVFHTLPGVIPEYFTALFKIPLLQSLFRSFSKGLGTGSSGFLRLYSEDFLSLWFPAPSVEEQQEIIDFLKQDYAQNAQIETDLNLSISLLKERRSALITAAVTGQLEEESMAG